MQDRLLSNARPAAPGSKIPNNSLTAEEWLQKAFAAAEKLNALFTAQR